MFTGRITRRRSVYYFFFQHCDFISKIVEWSLIVITDSLMDKVEKNRDYLMSLSDRFKRIYERGLKAPVEYQFSWIR